MVGAEFKKKIILKRKENEKKLILSSPLFIHVGCLWYHLPSVHWCWLPVVPSPLSSLVLAACGTLSYPQFTCVDCLWYPPSNPEFTRVGYLWHHLPSVHWCWLPVVPSPLSSLVLAACGTPSATQFTHACSMLGLWQSFNLHALTVAVLQSSCFDCGSPPIFML